MGFLQTQRMYSLDSLALYRLIDLYEMVIEDQAQIPMLEYPEIWGVYGSKLILR